MMARRTAAVKIRRVKLVDLKPHPKNAEIRQHPEPGSPEWEALRRSLDNVYFEPIVVNDRNGLMISGHLRLKVLQDMKYIQADVSVVDVDEETHLAMMVAANRMQGDDDLEGLMAILDKMGKMDIGLTGITENDLASMLEQQVEDYSDLDAQSSKLDGYEDSTVLVVVPIKHRDAVVEWLANGEPVTGPGIGRGVLKRCGLL